MLHTLQLCQSQNCSIQEQMVRRDKITSSVYVSQPKNLDLKASTVRVYIKANINLFL